MEKLNAMKARILNGQILRSVDELPLMSQSASKLMQTVADKGHSIGDIIEIVKFLVPTRPRRQRGIYLLLQN